MSGVSNLPIEIAKRQRQQIIKKLGAKLPLNDIRVRSLPGAGKGTFLVILLEFENSTACFSSLGRIGKRAEEVADEVIEKIEEFLMTDGCVDSFLADQLIIPLCFAGGESEIRTSKITSHLTTNIEIIQQFLSVDISLQGKLGHPGTIIILPDHDLGVF
jgi:RNA 3'-terminal phosphate cyclase (ATP)